MALCEEKYKLIHIFNGSIEIFWGGSSFKNKHRELCKSTDWVSDCVSVNSLIVCSFCLW